MGARGKHKDGRQHCTSCRSRYSRTVRKTRSGGASRNPRRYRRRTPDRGHVRAGSRGQVMGRQFGLAFDEIGTSLRRQYGSSPDSLLEQSGFEPLVPLEKDRLSAALISRSDQRQLPKATVGLIVRIRFPPVVSLRTIGPRNTRSSVTEPPPGPRRSVFGRPSLRNEEKLRRAPPQPSGGLDPTCGRRTSSCAGGCQKSSAERISGTLGAATLMRALA